MNSSAAIKAFTGRHGGTICTSSNAKTALTWALDKVGDGGKVLFLPDQHLGRNTFVRDLGGSLDGCVVFDPHKPMGGLTKQELQDATMILWRGHCSVHGRFSLAAVEQARREIPDVKVIVHPECQHEVVEAADEVGSTEKIIQTIAAAPDGTKWVVGTELNLVRRLGALFPRQQIAFLEKNVCYCSTMNRIDLPHLVWTLESLVAGRVVNAIRVDDEVAHFARLALDQMLALPGRDHEGLVRRWRPGLVLAAGGHPAAITTLGGLAGVSQPPGGVTHGSSHRQTHEDAGTSHPTSLLSRHASRTWSPRRRARPRRGPRRPRAPRSQRRRRWPAAWTTRGSSSSTATVTCTSPRPDGAAAPSAYPARKATTSVSGRPVR